MRIILKANIPKGYQSMRVIWLLYLNILKVTKPKIRNKSIKSQLSILTFLHGITDYEMQKDCKCLTGMISKITLV